jgi:hypothetical protein
LFDVKLEKSAEEPQVSDASPFESGMVVADLLGLIKKSDEARTAYEQLAEENPDKPDVERGTFATRLDLGQPEELPGSSKR